MIVKILWYGYVGGQVFCFTLRVIRVTLENERDIKNNGGKLNHYHHHPKNLSKSTKKINKYLFS